MNSCVIIGDIVKSRKLEDLPAVVGRLKQALGRVNRRYRGELVGAFKVFAGDSFEGVLRTPRHAYDVYREVATALRPARARCVVALGEITDLADGNVLEMNGPVFERAAEALRELGTPRKPRIHLLFISDDPEADSTLNAIAALIDHARQSWNDRTYAIYERYGKDLVETAADDLGIPRETFSRHIGARGIDAVVQGEKELRRQLERISACDVFSSHVDM